MNSNNANFYEQYGLKNIREAMKRPFSEAFPSGMIDTLPPPTSVIPQMRVHPAPGANDVLPPMPQLQNLQDHLPQLQLYPSSEPLLVKNPVFPNPEHHQQLPEATDDRPSKRRRTADTTPSIAENPFGKTDSVPVWHESKLRDDENPVPYMNLLGLQGKDGESFVMRILKRSNKFKSNSERIDFVESMFDRISGAVRKRQEENSCMTDDQLGVLIVSAFLLSNKISKRLETSKHHDLMSQVVYLALTFVNRTQGINSYIKNGIKYANTSDYYAFGGKSKYHLILWCSQNKTRLTDAEIDYLSKNRFQGEDLNGKKLLERLRSVLEEDKAE